MFDFFNELFQSEVVKNNKVAFTCVAVLIFVLGALLMWAYLKFIHYKIQNNEKKKVEEENQNLIADNVALTTENQNLSAQINTLNIKIEEYEKLLSEQKFSKDMKQYNRVKNNIDHAVSEFITQ